jgi:PhnB protein
MQMTDKVNAIPAGYHTATPFMIIGDAAAAIEFYKKAFGAVELYRMPTPDGKIAHAEIKIGDSPFMIAEEAPDRGYLGAKALGGTPISILLYVEDVDAMAEQAIAAGATLVKPVRDEFYGDRTGSFADPFGHQWHIATHKEDVSPEEMNRRMNEHMAQQSAQQAQA